MTPASFPASTIDAHALTVNLPGIQRGISDAEAWGVELIRGLQAFGGPAAESVFKSVTLFGEFEFFIFLSLMAMWAVDYRLGLRILGLVLFSGVINTFLKAVIASPRPFNFDPSIGAVGATGGGIPSGHAQHALIGWAAVASWFVEKRGDARADAGADAGADAEEDAASASPVGRPRMSPWIIVTVLVVAGAVGLSRVWLGAHFPHDVLVGWLVGAVVLLGYFGLRRPVSVWWWQLSPVGRSVAAVSAPLLLVLLPASSGGLEGGFESALALSGAALGAALMIGRTGAHGRESDGEASDSNEFDSEAEPESVNGRAPQPHVPSAPEAGVLRLIVGVAGIAIIGLIYSTTITFLSPAGDTAVRLAGAWVSGLWATFGAYAALPTRAVTPDEA